MLFRASTMRSTIEASRRRARKLRDKRCERISGKHAYCSSLMGLARSWLRSWRAMPSHFAKRIIRKHVADWNKMQSDFQHAFHNLAKEMRDEKQAQYALLLEKELDKLHDLEAKHRAHEEESSRLRVGSRRLSDAEKLDFDTLFNSDVWTRKHIDELRVAAVEPIAPPAAQIVAGLETFEDDDDGSGAHLVPAWARWIAIHREFFRRCVVRFEVAGEMKYYRVVYCIQAPTLVCLCQCEPCDDPEPHFDAVSFAVVDPDIFEHNFEYVLSSMKFSDNPDLQNPTSIHFLQDATFRRNRRLGCDGQWVSKQQVEEWLPPQQLLQLSPVGRSRSSWSQSLGWPTP